MTLRLPHMPPPPPNASDECYTPKYIIDAAVSILGGIDTDPAWSPASNVRPRIGYTYSEDGLARRWAGTVWCNPPYSDTGPWIDRIAAHDHPALALVKCDPTTAWWRRADATAAVLCLLSDRVRFEGPYAMGNSARFASALFGWRVAHGACVRKARGLGRWVDLGGAT